MSDIEQEDQEKKEVMEFITEQEQEVSDSSVKDFFIELLQVVIVALAIIIPVRYFFIKPFYVKGASMEPSFYDNEYLVIDEISYRFKEPLRGEIVVFKYPRDPKQFFIKRIVGLPGETVQVTGGGVFVNGDEIDETYLNPGTTSKGEIVVTLQSNEFFVLGDNRDFSLDSRSFGPLQENYIVGKTWIRGWPFDQITLFHPPEYSIDTAALEQ
jgi:signal peptidase I